MLGDREGIEIKRRAIAKFFGYEYQAFLDFGQAIIDKQTKPKEKPPDSVLCNIQDEAIKRHQIVIEGFEDREWALSVNEMLLQIEKRGTAEMKELAKGAIENILKILPSSAACKECQKNGTE